MVGQGASSKGAPEGCSQLQWGSIKTYDPAPLQEAGSFQTNPDQLQPCGNPFPAPVAPGTLGEAPTPEPLPSGRRLPTASLQEFLHRAGSLQAAPLSQDVGRDSWLTPGHSLPRLCLPGEAFLPLVKGFTCGLCACGHRGRLTGFTRFLGAARGLPSFTAMVGFFCLSPSRMKKSTSGMKISKDSTHWRGGGRAWVSQRAGGDLQAEPSVPRSGLDLLCQ